MKVQNTFTVGIILATAMLVAGPAQAGQITYVGTWDSVSSGNTATGGPGLTVGQKYVIRLNYSNASTVTNNVDVLDSFFNPSGDKMSTIDLTAAGNSLDIFVPMEGLDAGSPVIYQQNETNHFPVFIPEPTLNFVDGSDISNTSNIIGLEFEGDFAGAGNNVIELFNTSPGGGTINMVSQVLNCGDPSCSAPAPASNDTNGLVVAADLVINAGSDIVYSAASLTQATASSVTQSNDLGAARSDGEDFIDAAWSPTGTASGNDISVDIENSGLTMTTDTTSWDVTMTEQMTLESDSDSVIVSYLNAAPSASASAVANAGGYDFTFASADDDLMVNALIAAFEELGFIVKVDGATTMFFDDLIMNGTQFSTDAMLAANFAVGAHTLSITVTDKAGEFVEVNAGFEVAQGQNTVPEPGTLLLLIMGLTGICLSRQRYTHVA